MRCKECEFVNPTKSDKCPYCGNTYDKRYLANRRVKLGRFYFPFKVFIPFLAFNVLWILIGLDVVLYLTTNVNYHISPWGYLIITSVVLLIDCGVLTKDEITKFFVKSCFIINIFCILLSISYWNDPFIFNDLRAYQIAYSVLMPIYFICFTIYNLITFLYSKEYNLLTTVLKALFSFGYMIVIFILSFCNIGIGFDFASMLIISISFGITALIFLNSLVLSLYKMSTRVIKEDYYGK